jgi:anaphase-promoting complex subunit 4
MGLENNKAVHHIRPSEGFSSRITHIAWTRNLIGSRRDNPTRDDWLSWDEKLEKVFDGKGNDNLLNLPHELTFLEVDNTLPKLSPLPVSGGSG